MSTKFDGITLNGVPLDDVIDSEEKKTSEVDLRQKISDLKKALRQDTSAPTYRKAKPPIPGALLRADRKAAREEAKQQNGPVTVYSREEVKEMNLAKRLAETPTIIGKVLLILQTYREEFMTAYDVLDHLVNTEPVKVHGAMSTIRTSKAFNLLYSTKKQTDPRGVTKDMVAIKWNDREYPMDVLMQKYNAARLALKYERQGKKSFKDRRKKSSLHVVPPPEVPPLLAPEEGESVVTAAVTELPPPPPKETTFPPSSWSDGAPVSDVPKAEVDFDEIGTAAAMLLQVAAKKGVKVTISLSN